MKTIIFVSLCLCLLVSTVVADKSHKHSGDSKKLLKNGGHEKKHQLKELPEHKLEHAPKSALPLKEETNHHGVVAGEQKPVREGGRKHRHGKNRKGGEHHQQQQQQQHPSGGRARKSHGKSKSNPNGPSKTHHNKHSRKQGRGKQVHQQQQQQAPQQQQPPQQQ
ncbi:uncharacterized protein LOC101898159 [Musca domestica]|uniref:50 kDa gamma-zein n=1 Tax=Musca domestica TaxID=7370 RepID=T1PI04_MUSDO|nr:uncharacterized protein LOC101898159 [Musca domestica]